jgi:prepilin-type N-terminal cleavage/methylation domain-containing protein
MLKHRTYARAGFTLIEMLCVVVIFAIAAAIVFAGMSSQSDLQAESAARAVMADILYAQNRAIATQQPVYLTFNTTGSVVNGLPAYTYAECSALPTTYLTNPVTHDNYTNNWTSQSWSVSSVGITDSSTGSAATSFCFNSLGTPCSSTNTSLPLTTNSTVTVSSGGYSVVITIQANTGDTTVQ